MIGFIVEVIAALVGGIIIEVTRTAVGPSPRSEEKQRERNGRDRMTRHDHRWGWRSMIRKRQVKRTLVYGGIILLLLVLSDLTPIRLGETVRVLVLGLPQQEKAVVETLRAFDQGQFQMAVDRSKALIDAYGPSATIEQKNLEAANVSKWPVGAVPVERAWASMAIFDRGSLNSVALGWWVVGRSEERLDLNCEAKTAYEAAAGYSYARTWDPQWWPLRGWSPYGWFWAPPDDAQERAKSVKCNEHASSNGKGQ